MAFGKGGQQARAVRTQLFVVHILHSSSGTIHLAKLSKKAGEFSSFSSNNAIPIHIVYSPGRKKTEQFIWEWSIESLCPLRDMHVGTRPYKLWMGMDAS